MDHKLKTMQKPKDCATRILVEL